MEDKADRPAAGVVPRGRLMTEEGGASGRRFGMGEGGRSAKVLFNVIAYARKCSARLPPRWDRRTRDFAKVLLNYRGARRALPRQLLYPLLRRSSRVLVVPFGRAQLLIPTDDHEIARVVFATGGYERLYMARAVAEMAELGFPAASRTFVDIGANIGTSTIDALVEFGFARAVCFEPEARNFRLLAANVALNGLEDRVKAYPAALSDRPGFSLLETSATNWGDNRIVTADGARQDGDDNFVEIECRRFDDLVDDGSIVLDEVGLIWLDAQGHEPLVLAGAGKALAAGIPVVMEYSPAALRDNGTLDALEAIIREHYTVVIDLHMLSAGLRDEALLKAADIDRLREMGDRDHTDLLLVRSRAARHTLGQ
jgi:FkbM family methyltransferase